MQIGRLFIKTDINEYGGRNGSRFIDDSKSRD